jgi:hypothetical protein
LDVAGLDVASANSYFDVVAKFYAAIRFAVDQECYLGGCLKLGCRIHILLLFGVQGSLSEGPFGILLRGKLSLKKSLILSLILSLICSGHRLSEGFSFSEEISFATLALVLQ